MYADDTSESLLARAWSDLDLGRLTAHQALELWGEGIKQGSNARADEVANAKGELRELEDEKDAVEWQLKVALEAVKKLRESIGATLCEVSACLGKLTNERIRPTREEVFEWDVKCSDVLRELEEVANNTCLRPGRDDDFRQAADVLGIEPHDD